MNNINNKYHSGIDGIRAFAVISVMLYHLNTSLLPGGFSGVDVFFVISGYVVSLSLSKNFNLNNLSFFTSFYSRRILRILPALLICLIITSLFTTLFIPEAWLSSSINKTGIFSFFGISNYALLSFNDGYFSPRVEFNPFAHTWSLGLEEQFYLIFPFGFFLWLSCNKKNYIFKAVGNYLLPILFITSLIISSTESSTDSQKAFYLLVSRFWELCSGALLFMAHSKNKMLVKSVSKQKLLLSLGLSCLLLSFFFSDKKAFPFPWAILAVVATILLISAIVSETKKQSLLKNIFENKVATQIGKTSYSLYLWHWPIYVLFKWTIGLTTILTICLAIISTFIVANLSYYYVEQPFRKKIAIKSQHHWKIILIGLFSIAICSFSANWIFKSQEQISLSITKNKKIWYPIAWPETNHSVNKIYSERKLFVIGDSHADAYSTMLQKLSDDFGVKVITYSKGGCGFANLLTEGTLFGGISSSKPCKKHNHYVISQIKSLASPGDIILLASLRMNRFGSQWHLFSQEEMNQVQFSEKAKLSRMKALEHAKLLVSELEKLNVNIVIDAPKPIFKSPPFRCSDWFNQHNPICESGNVIKKEVLLKHRQPVMDSLTKLRNQFPKLLVWDPFPILCKTDKCSSFDKNKPLFFDGHHLSAHGNRVLYPSFTILIKKIWPEE